MGTIYISKPDQLFKLMTQQDGYSWTNPNITYCLTDNIDMGGFICESIGNNAIPEPNPFEGSFNGKGFSVTINSVSPSFAGFFGYLSNNTVFELTVNYTCSSIGDNSLTYVGGLCANNAADNSITNCQVNFLNDVTIISNSSSGSAGGLCGTSSQTTKNSNVKFFGNVTINSFGFGFLVGNNNTNSLLNNCYAIVKGNVDEILTGGYGGLCAQTNGSVNLCSLVCLGTVTLNTNTSKFYGGVVGSKLSGGALGNCVVIYGNNVTVIGEYVGGVIGQGTDDVINNCHCLYFGTTLFNQGYTEGTNVGPLYAVLNDISEISNCTAFYYSYYLNNTTIPTPSLSGTNYAYSYSSTVPSGSQTISHTAETFTAANNVLTNNGFTAVKYILQLSDSGDSSNLTNTLNNIITNSYEYPKDFTVNAIEAAMLKRQIFNINTTFGTIKPYLTDYEILNNDQTVIYSIPYGDTYQVPNDDIYFLSVEATKLKVYNVSTYDFLEVMNGLVIDNKLVRVGSEHKISPYIFRVEGTGSGLLTVIDENNLPKNGDTGSWWWIVCIVIGIIGLIVIAYFVYYNRLSSKLEVTNLQSYNPESISTLSFRENTWKDFDL